ncbi:MAG TPA: HK97 gp10 family phage protein [Bacteroidales bacterium]|nr:HK97 gp10 family phage protein [Bacteroidales bacterium]
MSKRSKWRTKEAVKIAEEAGLKALRTGAEAILTEAIDETPIDTGTLRRSGTVTVGALPDGAQVYEAAESGSDMKDAFPGPEGKEKAVYISFNTPYARRQHEELDYEHPRGGKAKYLEDPFNRNKKKVLQYAEKQVKKALEKAK